MTQLSCLHSVHPKKEADQTRFNIRKLYGNPTRTFLATSLKTGVSHDILVRRLFETSLVSVIIIKIKTEPVFKRYVLYPDKTVMPFQRLIRISSLRPEFFRRTRKRLDCEN